MQLHEMMTEARLEHGYPPTHTDWDRHIEEFLIDPNKFLFHNEFGFIAGMVTADHLMMDGIRICLEVAWYVKPEHRKQGVGSELYNLLCEWAISKGCKYIIQGIPTEGCTKAGHMYMRKL